MPNKLKREMITRLLEQCTPDQRDICLRIYKSLNSINHNADRWAYGYCTRATERNKRRSRRRAMPARSCIRCGSGCADDKFYCSDACIVEAGNLLFEALFRNGRKTIVRNLIDEGDTYDTGTKS